MLNIELPIDLHISGFLNTEKVDIEERKVDIQSKKWTFKAKSGHSKQKVDIEKILSNKGTDFRLKQLFISIVFVSWKN